MTYRELRKTEVQLARGAVKHTKLLYNEDPNNELGDSPSLEDIEAEQAQYEKILAEYEREFNEKT